LRGIVAGVFILFLGMVYFAYAAPKDETEAVLQPADSFFKAMKQRNYLVVWKLLSNKSMTAIVEETAKRAASRNHSAVQKGGAARRLKMFKEDNQWKVGLIETFGMER
jgi:hypothetical protein